jgi:short-subunit dehydrogenase involved in D-alanine esterification of teichoic acids
MKKKELKSLAKRIADAEYIIQTSSDKKEINKAKNTIIELSNHAIDLEDIAILDEMVQDILSQKMS